MTKLPPSPSGIGLYGEAFQSVLGSLGSVRTERAPAEPRDSQRLRSAVTGLAKGWRSDPRDVVHVELSGRALFEFYYAVGRAVRRRGAPLVITCHDAPSLVGSPTLFRGLDRRGLRRIGMVLGRVVGRRAESFVMSRSSLVLTLTQAGAAAISASYGRDVVALPHVVLPRRQVSKERLVFVPGYVSDEWAVSEIVQIVRRHALETGEAWAVVVGVCTRPVAEVVTSLVQSETVSVRLTGLLTEQALLEFYDRAEVVVRPVSAGADNAHAASGPLCWAAAAGCVIVTNDGRAGARDLEAWNLAIRDEGLSAALKHVLRRGGCDIEGAPERASRALSRMGVDAVAHRYAEALLEVGLLAAGPVGAPVLTGGSSQTTGRRRPCTAVAEHARDE